jgi:hypothetical protein
MNALQSDSAELPANSFLEVRFEDLEANPLAELKKIYQTLDLSDFERAYFHFEAYLAGLRGYRKNQDEYDSEAIQMVESRWMPFVKRWGYAPPKPQNSVNIARAS